MKPEIMSPVGGLPQLHAAIEAGADAVYFGLKHFSARAKVGFSLEELPEVMRTLHRRGVRGYLTFNTLIFEHELGEAAKTAAAIVEAGADALIVQDLGILRLLRRIAPTGIELHASTQMSITDAEGVRFAQSCGADRVTLARELSLDEVKTIHEQTGGALEMFVHGALCVAYSGQCFSSEAWGGRSANRGQCAQACRLPYDLIVDGEPEPLGDARYLLSPGDLYTLKEVPAIVASGVSALKIEGRYKDAEYVALTTQAYRKAVDDAWAGLPHEVTRAEELRLEQVYSRGLGPFFVNGTDHQSVVRGRAPRHRGVLIGSVIDVETDRVLVEPSDAAGIAPLKEGDGLVFDAADWRSPEEPEEGGRIYEISRARGVVLGLRFANRAIRFERIRPGDLVWRTSSIETTAAARPFTEATSPVSRQRVRIRVTAREGSPLLTEWSLDTVGRTPRSATDAPVGLPGQRSSGSGGTRADEGVRPTSVTVRSPAPLQTALNRSLSLDIVQTQFGRLGNTPYELADVSLDVEGAPFAPVSVLNEMRRQAVDALRALQEAPRPTEVNDPVAALTVARCQLPPIAANGAIQLHLLVRTPEQLDAALECSPASITLDYLDLYGLRPSIERVKAGGLAARVASPRVLKPGEARILNFLLSLDCQILVRSTGVLHALRTREHPPLIGDFSLNAANSLSAAEYLALGLSRLTPTHDLNAAQIAALARDSGGENIEAIAYHHLPVFHTEHCVFCRFLSNGTSYRDCGRPCETHRVELRDQSGRAHPVIADVGCRNTVFGAEAQEASLHLDLWRSAGIRHFRLEFAHESGTQVSQISQLFRNAFHASGSITQLHRELKAIAPQGTTQGSLFVPANYLTLPILQ